MPREMRSNTVVTLVVLGGIVAALVAAYAGYAIRQSAADSQPSRPAAAEPDPQPRQAPQPPTVPLAEREARRTADRILAHFAGDKGVPVEAFGEPEVAAEPPYPWVFTYVSDSVPRYHLKVHVDESNTPHTFFYVE